jgi:hypothetical protein
MTVDKSNNSASGFPRNHARSGDVRCRILPAEYAAVNIAKLPSVPRQILKDIPRPPNTASRDD